MGIKGLFENYLQDYKYLFDLGEIHALALAKAMGLVALLSDDTKDFGPHKTLVKELIEDVIPFSFYELLFLKYLESNMTPRELYNEFENINSKSMNQHSMNFRSRMLATVRRFSNKHGTERDKQWINKFCDSKDIIINNKMVGLKDFLRTL